MQKVHDSKTEAPQIVSKYPAQGQVDTRVGVSWYSDQTVQQLSKSGLELAGGRGGCPRHWVSLSSLLFVLLASPRGTENAINDTSACLLIYYRSAA